MEEFNRNNKHMKKGISMIPSKFGLGFTLKAMNQVRGVREENFSRREFLRFIAVVCCFFFFLILFPPSLSPNSLRPLALSTFTQMGLFLFLMGAWKWVREFTQK